MLNGCSSDPVATVDLKVVHQGEPVVGAEVLIEPDTSGQGSVFGITSDDGTCAFDWGERDGLVPGKYRISVTQFEGTDGKSLAGSEEGQAQIQGGQAVRKNYLFRQELTAGEATLSLSLESADEQTVEE